MSTLLANVDTITNLERCAHVEGGRQCLRPVHLGDERHHIVGDFTADVEQLWNALAAAQSLLWHV